MATGKRLRYDGIETYLDQDLSFGETVVSFSKRLEADGGVAIDALSAGEYLSLSILTPNYLLSEIVHLVSYDEGALTGIIERGQEGTSPKDHVAGQKVVHAATTDDFFDVQQHLDDPNAHSHFINDTIDAKIADAFVAHKAESDPHPQYMRETDVVFDHGATLPGGQVLKVEAGATLLVEQGGQIVVNGDLRIEGTGRIFINGHQLVISNTEPPNASANVVWLQTFG